MIVLQFLTVSCVQTDKQLVVLPPCWEMKRLVTKAGLEHLSALEYFSGRICFYSINTSNFSELSICFLRS